MCPNQNAVPARISDKLPSIHPNTKLHQEEERGSLRPRNKAACRLVALDKRPGVRSVGIGETLRWDLARLVMRAAREQAKAEGAAHEGRAAFSGKKEDNAVARSHRTYPYLV